MTKDKCSLRWFRSGAQHEDPRRLIKPFVGLFLACAPALFAADPIPKPHLDFLYNYCIDCHNEETAKGDLNLELAKADWTSGAVRRHWEEVYMMLSRKMMPPKKKSQPTSIERNGFLAWLDKELVNKSPIGGTPLRRLNGREYQQTIRDLFSLKDFKLPDIFPADNASEGFDTMGEALVISPAHLGAYTEVAVIVADAIFPPIRKAPESRQWIAKPKDMAINASSATIIDGAMRLASTGDRNRNASWLSHFEAPISGTYAVTLQLSAKNPPPGATPVFGLVAYKLQGGQGGRKLTTFKITSNTPETYTAEVDLYRGETVGLTYTNAPLNYGKADEYRPFIENLLRGNHRLAAAWKHLGPQPRGGVPRGGIGWENLKKTMADPNFKADLSPEQIEEVIIAVLKRKKHHTGEAIVYRYFENGPNIGIHEVAVEGPLKLIEDPIAKKQLQVNAPFLGDARGKSDRATITKVLEPYLTKAFRRPATFGEISAYAKLVEREVNAGRDVEAGYHLAIRTSLVSPNFMYREQGEELSNYELASRLSYFLGTMPPDAKLTELAASGKLKSADVLRREAMRLIKSDRPRGRFIHDFTSQWLDTDLLENLMPDPKLFKNFNGGHRRIMMQEVEQSFSEILVKNQPTSDFIDPDFLYTDKSIGSEIYELAAYPKKKGAPKAGSIKRISIERGTRRGGLLAMPAIMMATANGVDTQPVLRGVWFLENILGSPPPEPPEAVPALTPDTNGARSLREQLAAHMADPSCAACHQDIDPIGFVLENFDPVGRWRTHYPSLNETAAIPIDATGSLPDGTVLNDVTDLKKLLMKSPEYFTTCIARKLLTYGTGRQLNYRERKIVEDICAKNIANKDGFQDLLLELVDSTVFRAR